MTKAWKEAVGALAYQVEGWVTKDLAQPGRFVLHELAMDPVPDEPLLEIEVNGQELLKLEPAEFAADKLPTSVHLYAYPTLRRAVLFGPDENSNWEIQSSEGVPMNYSWDSKSFLDLLMILAERNVAKRV